MNEEELSSYPENTSHLKRWVASSRKEYFRVERTLHERSLQRVVAEKTQIESASETLTIARTCPLTLEKQNDVLIWFVKSLIEITTAHQFDFRVVDTTLAYYRRFYLRECVVRYPPNLYLFTAMIVAIKCENAVVENRSPPLLFGGTGKETAFHEALDLEATLSQTIHFDFFILHGDAPITHYINSYYGFRKKNNLLTTPSVGWPGPKSRSSKARTSHKDSSSRQTKKADDKEGEDSAAALVDDKAEEDEDLAAEKPLTEEQIFVEWLAVLQQTCEKSYLQLYASTTHFIFRPAEVAAGVFVHVTKQTFQLKDIDEFMAAVLPPQIRGDEKRTKNVLRIIALTAHEAFKQEEQVAKYDTDYWRPKIHEYLKEARKWVRQLEKKRKLPENADASASEPPSKRSKV